MIIIPYIFVLVGHSINVEIRENLVDVHEEDKASKGFEQNDPISAHSSEFGSLPLFRPQHVKRSEDGRMMPI